MRDGDVFRGESVINGINLTMDSVRRVLPALALFIVFFGFSIEPAVAGIRGVELVSRASGTGGADANGDSFDPAISANGRFVAFESTASNLDAAVGQLNRQVYVRDLAKDETILVSRASGADGAVANGLSFSPSISGDGRFIAFASQATNIAGSVVGPTAQIYVRDLVTQTTLLVSRSPATGQQADDGATDPSISANGRFVAFLSDSRNLVSDLGEFASSEQAFVVDVSSGSVEVASRDRHGGAAVFGVPDGPAISGSGEVVAFGSWQRIDSKGARGQDFSDAPGLFARDLASGKVRLASRDDGRGRTEGAAAEFEESISHDGTRVPFVSGYRLAGEAEDTADDAYVRDLDSRRTLLLSRGFGESRASGPRVASQAVISANGRVGSFIISRRFEGNASRVSGLFVRDLKRRSTDHMPGTRQSPIRSLSSSLSGNGRLVAFSSSNPKLGVNDGRDAVDIFLFRPPR